MSVAQIPAGGKPSVQPIAAIGTYTLAVPLLPGLYRITTDTTQTFTTAQLYFQTAAGYRFGAVVRGGEGYVAIPETVTTVTLTSGTFPLLLGLERFSSYTLIAAPTNLAWTYGGPSSTTVDLAFTLPAGATGIGLYWTNGTFVDLATTTSPKTGISLPSTPLLGVTFPALAVAKDANGVFGLGGNPSGAFPWQTFTTSGTYTPPTGSASATVYVIGGGGGGGGTGVGSGGISGAGGGGAGGYITQTVATSGSVAVTIGAAGNGGTSANTGNGTNGNAGGATSFGAVTTNGGGFGGSWGVLGQAGACGGGGGGGSSGTSTGNVGFGGGSAAGFQSGGGGGGMANAGGAATGPVAPGGGGGALLVNAISLSVSGGGGGGSINGTNGNGNQGGTPNFAGSGGGGGGRGNTSLANGAAGRAGAVYVRALGI